MMVLRNVRTIAVHGKPAPFPANRPNKRACNIPREKVTSAHADRAARRSSDGDNDEWQTGATVYPARNLLRTPVLEPLAAFDAAASKQKM